MTTNNNTQNTQQTTFWKFLNDHTIEIPIIQRDYAQGRIGKEKLRENFLTDIKKALDEELDNKEKVLKLDFVYGSVENGTFNPLDGQQRLTTLWLLHWYIAFKVGKLQENKEIFKRFTYKTRTSSREFSNRLSEFNVENNNGNIVDLIQNQTWFYSAWKQDPTIQAMLNMLGGTPIKDEKKNEIIDGLEEIFESVDKEIFIRYWDKLTGENCPIIFYQLDLLDLQLTDDLYIKMNARGKQLTPFENFKADMVGYIEKKGIDKDKEPQNTIVHKLDTVWTDLFWKFRSDDFKIDEIYFAFINRYLLNKYIAKSEKSVEKLETDNFFKYLYGNKGNDTEIEYSSFDIYKVDNLKEYIKSLEKVLDRFYAIFKDKEKNEINKLFFPSWDENSDFRLIPEYNENKPISLTQPHRVVFYAMSSYLEHTESYNEISFKRWMRVVWNIVENANIYTIQAMIGAIRLIDALAEHSNSIYEHLKGRDVSNDFAKEQMEEEKEKAKKIWEDKKWENKIIDAEKTAFFKGAIRFLFRIGENDYDWGKFNSRFEKAKEYFDKEGVKESYKKDAILLRSLISKFSEFDHFKGTIFDNNSTSWRLILLNKKWIMPVNEWFTIDNPFDIDLKSFESPINTGAKLKNMHNDLCKTSIIQHFKPGSRFNWWRYDKYSIYPFNAKSPKNKFVLGDKRNEILSRLVEEGIIESEQKVKGLPSFWGWEIFFTCCHKKFMWWNGLKQENEQGKWIKIEKISLENLKDYLEQ